MEELDLTPTQVLRLAVATVVLHGLHVGQVTNPDMTIQNCVDLAYKGADALIARAKEGPSG